MSKWFQTQIKNTTLIEENGADEEVINKLVGEIVDLDL